MDKINILAIDDDISALNLLSSLIARTGLAYKIHTTTKPEELFPILSDKKFDLVFLDVEMPRISGIDLLKKIRKIDQGLPVVIISAHEKYAVEASHNQIFDYLLKP